MNALTNFAFEEHLVRVVELDGEPWFVGKDVCSVLGIKDHKQALESLDDDERGRYTIPTPGGDQDGIIVSEPGVYRMVFRSRKEEAERFKRWLAHEVIPAIRRTGEYRVARPVAPPVAESLIADRRLSLAIVSEARLLFGPARARALWETMPELPQVPLSSGAPVEGLPAEAAEVLAHLFESPAGGDYQSLGELLRAGDDEALEALGLRRTAGGLFVAVAKPELKTVFARTRWRDGLWVSVLKRLPEITGGHERMLIGGFRCRPIFIPSRLLPC